MSDAATTAAIMADLRAQSSRLINAEEVQFADGRRRCDFWTMSPHGDHRVIAYEVKVSRADFRRDSQAKQEYALKFSDQFFYVAPKGLLQQDELPDWAGLIDWCPQRKRPFQHKRKAPVRSKQAPNWSVLVSLIRNSVAMRRDTYQIRERVSAQAAYIARLERDISNAKQTSAEAWLQVQALRAQTTTQGESHE